MKETLTPEEVAQLLAKEFLTPQEIAKLMRLNVKTVYVLLDNGELQGKKWGNQWRVHRSQLNA
ncbi:helix-turn-helix domain-containing protein [Alicyclobacillus tolerans]|uniref:helix-turn-helix domain-containing protein n=1 Tax=Alicyclobacillus tolerans TaxID=90970 RepID=UPI001F4747FE|nr:helix-turn-helix domain-containing protein [Alicyclobacillus tolerans]MCF8564982.1 helix-turn-helix domain-containing protein [Alicyclobacillus tolerans]